MSLLMVIPIIELTIYGFYLWITNRFIRNIFNGTLFTLLLLFYVTDILNLRAVFFLFMSILWFVSFMDVSKRVVDLSMNP